MAKKLEYTVGLDSSDAQRGVKDFARTVQSELKNVEGDFDDTATAGERVATVLSQLAGKLDDELGRAALAADALAQALGPELTAKADVGSLVGDLQRMGLTFEDIVADADKLAGALKEMDAVQVKGLDAGLGGVKTSVGDIGKSADSSRSALANMIGNTTQDLGALGGIAGSAGVAIGQMGEYAADAALGGEKLGSALKSMALVAGPIAALTLATQTFSTILGGIHAEEVFKAELVDDFTEAIKEGTDEVEVLKQRIEETGELAFETGALGGGGFLGLGSSAKDIIPTLNKLGIGFKGWQKLLKDTSAVDRYRDKGLELASTNVEQATQYLAVADALETYQESIGIAGVKQDDLNQFMGVTVEGTKAYVAQLAEAVLKAAARKAQIEDAAAATEALKIKTEETAAAWDEIDAKVDEWTASVGEAKASVGEMMDEFDASKVETVTTALGEFLAARQPGVQWLDTIADTKEAFRDIWSDIKDNEDAIPDIFAVSTEKGRDFRDAIDAASQSVNQQLLTALENAEGDFAKVREQADALREQMIKKIELKTGLSMDVPAEKIKILGLVNAVVPTDKQIEVGIALAKDDLTKLKADLAIEQLQALLPATALQLKVDMAEGEITPAEAAATAQQILTDNGLDVDLDVNTKKADQDLIDFAAKERTAALGIVVPPKSLTDANDTIRLGPGGTGWPAIEVPVKPVVVAGGYSYITGGGAGTLAPTGRGTAPAAAAGAGMAPIAIPVTAAQRQEIHLHSHVNANVIGDSFDLMRTIDEANRKAARLLPKNP